jgi:hypothetical protein
MITYVELGLTNEVGVSLVSPWPWRSAGDTLNITCNFLYCNHRVHRDFFVTLYIAQFVNYNSTVTIPSNISKQISLNLQRTSTCVGHYRSYQEVHYNLKDGVGISHFVYDE